MPSSSLRFPRNSIDSIFCASAYPAFPRRAAAVSQYYTDDDAAIPSLILLPELPADAPMLRHWLSERRGSAVRLLSPARGERRRLLRLADENAREKLRAMAER